MSTAMYRAGETHNVRGTVCEMKVFEIPEIESATAEGWVMSPEEVKDDLFEGLENKEIRQLAKDAGNEDWDSARIETLKSELIDGYR